MLLIFFIDMKSRKPSLSETIKTEVVCPNDANPMGILLGGQLVHWMDIAAAVTAQTHSGKICVTASINNIRFKHPTKIGDVLIIKAKITRAFNTSMEIYVQVFRKSASSVDKQFISDSFFTFVILNSEKNTEKIIAVNPVSKEEKLLYDEALKRKKKYIEESK